MVPDQKIARLDVQMEIAHPMQLPDVCSQHPDRVQRLMQRYIAILVIGHSMVELHDHIQRAIPLIQGRDDNAVPNFVIIAKAQQKLMRSPQLLEGTLPLVPAFPYQHAAPSRDGSMVWIAFLYPAAQPGIAAIDQRRLIGDAACALSNRAFHTKRS